MQINRLFEIVYILLDKNITSAKELAEHFEVSTRTIYRDVDTLSKAGIPIYATQGKNGGIALLDNFVLNKTVISEAEQNNILFALKSFTATAYPEIEDTLSKLSSLFKKDNRNWIEVDFSNWGNDNKSEDKFNILKEAITNNKIITFKYYNSRGDKINRKVEPTKLSFKAKAWYLKGFCLLREENRTFKINRMFDIEITEEIFISRPLSESIIETNNQQKQSLINLKLYFPKKAAHRIYDEFNEKDIVKNKNGSFIVKAAFEEGDWIYDYILSFGTTVEVLEPEKVRVIIANKLEKMIKKYK